MNLPLPPSPLLAFAVAAFIAAGVRAFVLDPPALSRRIRIQPIQRTPIFAASSGSGSGDDGGEEWRAFRARLVRDGLPSLDDGILSESSIADANRTSTKHPHNSRRNDRYAHLTTPLVEVGSVLLAIPTTDLCQALEQQYWHRSVVLVTEVSEDLVNGNAEERVPDEQLAEGDGRGRWSFRGLMLNRCTSDFSHCGNHQRDIQNTSSTYVEPWGQTPPNGWRVHRGGDLLGLDSSLDTHFQCLHHRRASGPLDSGSQPSGHAAQASTPSTTKLVGNLSLVTLADAQSLCQNDDPAVPHPVTTDDIATFAGFCSWRPGQLETEMGAGRNEWMVLSVDGETIWDEVQSQSRRIRDGGGGDGRGARPLEAGTDMWRAFLDRAGVSESRATERLPAGQLDFYDRMLQVWAEDHLSAARGDGRTGGGGGAAAAEASRADDDSSDTVLDDEGSPDDVGPGTLVRAASPPSNDMLLYDAEFVRSLILILEDGPDATVGILLNRPMAAAVECTEDGDPLTLRYGGPADLSSWRDGSYREDGGGDKPSSPKVEEEGYGMFADFLDLQEEGISFDALQFDDGGDDTDDGDDDDESTFVWIHRDTALGSQGVGGTRLGKSNLWLITEEDALISLQSGTLRLEDTMVFSGVCIWGEGIREQVDVFHSLEVVYPSNNRQREKDAMMDDIWNILTTRQSILAKETLESNMHAAKDAWEISHPTTKTDADPVSKSKLADATLKAWIAVNLLQDPLGTLVEVRDDQRQDLPGQ